MRRALVLVWTLAACNGNGKDKDGPTDTPYTFDCEVSEPDDLADPFAVIEGQEHACEEQPKYNPAIPYATTYFVGEFHYDDCGTLKGRETQVLYANPRWEELGGHDCELVWNVDGSVEAAGGDDLIVRIAALLDAGETTCGDIEDPYGNSFLDFVDQTFNVEYQLTRNGRDATFHFLGGDELGTGEANANHSNYTSGMRCQAF